MTKGQIFAVLAAAGVVAAAIAPPLSAQSAKPSTRFGERLLHAHNSERVRVGAVPLQWNAKLAADAKQWADHLAQRGRLEHASYEQRAKAGENLWMGSAGYYSAETMIGGFIDERKDFRPGKFPDVSRTGKWQDVAHYTQVIWHDTREVGCAVSRDATNDFLVCRYLPVGNWIGQQIG
ncbi:CAP domain-containing protein [Allopontixanthobacter sp.]|uniref:CAP domain-containing protein n=1 Tax=Allopontixanthobacter sp. TaxID=2906452 RepID=UPI002ABB21F1|nr:CAP domain-containing protein [Allopontixanthobacter sp.]MDZ4306413.1 CAP domain-containing protein [Allopontixanthobacter sp.]